MFKYTLDYFLDFIFPRESLHQDSIHSYISASYISTLKPSFKIIPDKYKSFLNTLVIASDYHDVLLKDLISRAKFSGETCICKDLVKLLSKAVAVAFVNTPDVVISVPADPKRYVTRGYHIPSILANYLALDLGVKYIPMVVKTIHTESQINLSHSDRLASLESAFAINLDYKIHTQKNINILIVDDISTTGATIGEISVVIKKAYPLANISGIVCASN